MQVCFNSSPEPNYSCKLLPPRCPQVYKQELAAMVNNTSPFLRGGRVLNFLTFKICFILILMDYFEIRNVKE